MKNKSKAFTLIELIVVISIIVLLTTVSMAFFSRIIKNESLKKSGLTVKVTFGKARQLAATQRIMHFLVFEPNKSLMIIYKDTNENQICETDSDEQVGEEVELQKGISFLSGSGGPPLFKLAQPYIGFRSDASLMLPAGISDLSFIYPPKPEVTDIVLEQKNRPKSKMYLDYTRGTGRIRLMRLYTEK